MIIFYVYLCVLEAGIEFDTLNKESHEYQDIVSEMMCWLHHSSQHLRKSQNSNQCSTFNPIQQLGCVSNSSKKQARHHEKLSPDSRHVDCVVRTTSSLSSIFFHQDSCQPKHGRRECNGFHVMNKTFPCLFSDRIGTVTTKPVRPS